jgi:hypothetical protein
VERVKDKVKIYKFLAHFSAKFVVNIFYKKNSSALIAKAKESNDNNF